MGDVPLDVRLELAERVAVGAPLSGRLTIRNRGSEAVSVLAPSSAAVVTLVLLDRYWNVVPPSPRAKVHAAPERIELDPGASVAFDLAGLSFVSGTAEMAYEPAPGIYHALAVYHPGTDRLPDRSSYPVVAVSGVATFEVAGA